MSASVYNHTHVHAYACVCLRFLCAGHAMPCVPACQVTVNLVTETALVRVRIPASKLASGSSSVGLPAALKDMGDSLAQVCVWGARVRGRGSLAQGDGGRRGRGRGEGADRSRGGRGCSTVC